MQLTHAISTLSVRFFLILSIILLAACDWNNRPEEPPRIEVIETTVQPPKPIVPEVDPIDMRPVEWIVVTEDNVQQVLERLSGSRVLFAVTSTGYENIALNLSSVRALVQQQRAIIAIYERSYSR
jgi:hypothetical protein